MFILETLDALCRALAAGNSLEVERLLDQRPDDLALISKDAGNLRDFLIGQADDRRLLRNYPWEVNAYKAARECSNRIFEEFSISDSVSIEGKSVEELQGTFDPLDLD